MQLFFCWFLDYSFFVLVQRFHQAALLKVFSSPERVLQPPSPSIVLAGVTEAGNKRKAWQLKAFLQGHRHHHHLALPRKNPGSHSPAVCLQRNSQRITTASMSLTSTSTTWFYWTLLLFLGPARRTWKLDALIKRAGPHPRGFRGGRCECLCALSVPVNASAGQVAR